MFSHLYHSYFFYHFLSFSVFCSTWVKGGEDYNLTANTWPACYAATTHTYWPGSVLSPHPAHHSPDDSPPSHTHTNHTQCSMPLPVKQKQALSDQVQHLYKRLRDIFLIFEQLISCKSCLISLRLS